MSNPFYEDLDDEDEDAYFDDDFDAPRPGELDDCDFADPGGTSALRRATKNNPRDRSCPTCKRKNVLTPKDVALGYQCNICADRAERGESPYGEY